MKTGFMDASGVDPYRMKIIVLTLVFSIILMIAAWIGKNLLEEYSDGAMEPRELSKLIISLLSIIFATLAFLVWF